MEQMQMQVIITRQAERLQVAMLLPYGFGVGEKHPSAEPLERRHRYFLLNFENETLD